MSLSGVASPRATEPKRATANNRSPNRSLKASVNRRASSFSASHAIAVTFGYNFAKLATTQ
jgi:hypothetical protein